MAVAGKGFFASSASVHVLDIELAVIIPGKPEEWEWFSIFPAGGNKA